MDNSELDPDLQALINEERTVASTRQSNFHTLKLEKGCSAYVRFLPVQLGPRKSWFARIARHWGIGGKPVFCQKHSAPDFNGDPKFPCPLCELESKYGQDRDKTTAEAARRIGAFPKWLVYVYVWETVDEKHRKAKTAEQDLYVPHEFWVARESYLELVNLWERSARLLGTKDGFLDPVKGYDFLIARDRSNALKIHEDMKGPIIPNKTADELYNMIDEGMARTKLPDYTPATADDMEEAVYKAEDLILGRRGREDRGSSRSRVDSYEDERGGRDAGGGGRGGGGSDAGGGGRGGRGEPAARSEAAPSRGEAPAGRGSRSAEPETPPSGRGSRSETESRGRTEPAQRESRREDPPDRSSRETPPPRERGGSDVRDFEATPGADTPPPVSSRTRGTTSADVLPPRTRSAPPPPPEKGGRTDGAEAEEEAPRERRDAAPPAETDPATLPAVTATTPAAAQGRLSENLRSRVSRFSAP